MERTDEYWKKRYAAFVWWGDRLGISENDIDSAGLWLEEAKGAEVVERKLRDGVPITGDLVYDPESETTGSDIKRFLTENFNQKNHRYFFTLYFYPKYGERKGFKPYLQDIEITIPVPDVVLKYLIDDGFMGTYAASLTEDTVKSLLPHIWRYQHGHAAGVLRGDSPLVGRLRYTSSVAQLVRDLGDEVDATGVTKVAQCEWLNSVFRLQDGRRDLLIGIDAYKKQRYVK